MPDNKLELNARDYAVSCHDSTNHLYDTQPYVFHLVMVVNIAKIHISDFPNLNKDEVLAACWAHDTIEDTRQTYNDVKKVLGENVADIVYACTTEKGKTRKERQSEKYYESIRNTPGAIFVKLCDRIANTSYSKTKGSDMFEKYKKEFPEFISQLGIENDPKYAKMLNHLKELYT